MVSITRSQFDVFRNPAFWDDNFIDDWDEVNDPVVTKDGDVVKIEIGAGKTFGNFGNNTTFYADVDKYCIIKCDALTATSWGIWFRKASDATWVSQSYNTIGIKTLDITTLTSEKIDRVVLQVVGVAGEYAEFDYVAICGKTRLVLAPGGVGEGECAIVQSLLSSGVSSVQPLKLNNKDGAYVDEIENHDVLLAYLYWEGDSAVKVFGGRIVEPGANADADTGEYWLMCEAKGHEEALQAPEQLIQEIYQGENGRTIITSALSYCSAITDKFVDVDEEIETLHEWEIDEKTSFSIINDVCRQAKTLGGVVGFDAYVDPAANCHVFKRGKYICTVTPTIRRYDISWDSLRVRNKIKVYGAKLKPHPYPRDIWSESTDNWTSDGTLSLDNADKKVGSNSIKTVRAAVPSTYMYYSMTSSVSFKWSHDYSKLHFWAKVSSTAGSPTNIGIRVCKDADLVNFYYAEVENIQADKWMEFIIDVGPRSNMNNYHFGTPDWNDINTLYFIFVNSGAADLTLKVDEPYFMKNYVSEVEDAVSQDKYGVRCREPEVDESLMSDLECEKRAQSWLDFLKEKITKITLVVKGNNGYTPGHKLRVVLSNEGVDDWFRILEVQHHLYGVNWDTILTLSNEPEFVDWVFAMTGTPQRSGASVVVATAEGDDIDYLNLQEAMDVIS